MKFHFLFPVLFLLTSFSFDLQAKPEYGKASYYSDSFHGQPTASGEIYNKNLYTAAHKSLPFGTVIKVTRMDNKRTVQVRINDRGPYIEGKIVDLSRKAAEALGMLTIGVADVKLEIISKPSKSLAKKEKKKSTQPSTETTASNNDRVGLPPKVIESIENSKTGNTVNVNKKPKKTPQSVAVKQSMTNVNAGNYKEYDLYKVQILRPEKKGYGLQIASLADYTNVFRQVATLQGKGYNNILINIEPNGLGEPIYKIVLGPFQSRDSANSFRKSFKKKNKMDGFIVDLGKF